MIDIDVVGGVDMRAGSARCSQGPARPRPVLNLSESFGHRKFVVEIIAGFETGHS